MRIEVLEFVSSLQELCVLFIFLLVFYLFVYFAYTAAKRIVLYNSFQTYSYAHTHTNPPKTNKQTKQTRVLSILGLLLKIEFEYTC